MPRLTGAAIAMWILVFAPLDPAAAPRTQPHMPSAAAAALPRFARFGWVSPPRESATPARYAELAGAGFNFTVLAWDDSGRVADNLLRLDLARPLGLRCLLLDNDLDSVSLADPPSLLLADTIVARYRDDPAFLGWYLGDEPLAADFPRLGELFEILRTRDPAHPAWNSLRPRWMFESLAGFEAHVRDYADATDPVVLCNNQYDFEVLGDRHQLTENVAVMGTVARERGIPFWGIVQLVEHWTYRAVTPGMLRWQIGQWLAGGARGIGVFTYWTPDPASGGDWQPAMIEWGTGHRTPAYDSVAAIHARLAPLGNTLAGMTWRAVRHVGSVPPGGVPFAPDSLLLGVEGRATLGSFSDSTGAAFLFVAHADSVSPGTVTLALLPGTGVARLGNSGAGWEALAVGGDSRLALGLAPGDYELLRLAPPGTVGIELFQDSRPTLNARPLPAREAVRLEWSGRPGQVRLELLDTAGRVVWSRRGAGAAGSVVWRGERDGGGVAGAGLYFARLAGPGAGSVCRVVWLGGAGARGGPIGR